MRGKNWGIVFAMVGLCSLSSNHADDSAPTDLLSCASKETCSSCIQTFGCAWCSHPSWIIRCMQHKPDNITGDAQGKARCPDEYLNFPVSRQEILEDKPLKGAPKVDEKSEEEAVQIRPQRVKLQGCDYVSFLLSYRKAFAFESCMDRYRKVRLWMQFS